MPGFRVDAVWDIETADWTEFVCGALWTRERGIELFRDEDDLAEALLTLPRSSVAWAHAGGRFDVLWLLDWCRRHACIPRAQVRMSGSAISALSLNGGAVFRDSYRLIPMSLSKASTMFAGGQEKLDLALPCVCGRDCAGFCSVSQSMPLSLRLRLEAYLVADVEALRDTLLNLSEYCAVNAIELRGTVASSSWASAKLHTGIEAAEWDLRAYRFARDGYYGGRVDVARVKAPTINRYDRNSSYPAALREPVPVGEMRLIPEAKRARMVWNRGNPGVYAVSVEIPEMLAPPLPVHVANRIAYPWGKISGTWTRPELEHAMDCGAKLVSVERALVWGTETALLRPYMEHVWALRANAATPALGQWLKWLANSLTGALAQSPEHDLIILGDKADDPRWDSVGIYDWIWRRTAFRIADRAHVECAGYLTGRARVELHRQILHAGSGWCYSDTDSVYATELLTRNVGAELGEWKFEGTGQNWVALAPKVYRYEGSDKVVVRAKGIPDAEESWTALLRGDKATNDAGVKSFLVAARGPTLFARSFTHKQLAPINEWVGARLRVHDGTTRAPHVRELAALDR